MHTIPNQGHCAHHVAQPAESWCSTCRWLLCRGCVEKTRGPRGSQVRCSRCSTLVSDLPQPASTGVAEMIEKLPEVPRFALGRGTLAVLGGLALLAAPLSWAIENNISGILALLGAILLAGIEAGVFFYLLRQAAAGSDGTSLRGPSFTSTWDDVYGPLARMIAALAPCIAVAIWTHVSLGSIALLSFSPVHSGAMVAALFLLPLLLLGAAIAGSAFAVLNPLTWFKALRLLGVRYLIVSTLFYVLVAALLAWTVWATPALLAIPLLGRLLGLLGGYLIMAAAAKLLGIALEPHV